MLDRPMPVVGIDDAEDFAKAVIRNLSELAAGIDERLQQSGRRVVNEVDLVVVAVADEIKLPGRGRAIERMEMPQCPVGELLGANVGAAGNAAKKFRIDP